MSNILSGEKLVQAHSKTNYELPLSGLKEFEPNNSWLEQKQIQSALDHRKNLLDNERIEKESNLMVADWKAEKCKALVSRKGKHWETFGHHSDNEDWLFPEETLFLMEMGCLECFYGEVPLSIQKGYSVLLRPENGCSFDEYRAFAHLCRAGYRVLRHLPNLTVTAYERTIKLDQHLKERMTYSNEQMEDLEPDKTQMTGKPKEHLIVPQSIDRNQSLTEPEKMDTGETTILEKPEEKSKEEITVSPKPLILNETMTNSEGIQTSKEKEIDRIIGLTKRQLWKIQKIYSNRLKKLDFQSVKKLYKVQNIVIRRKRRMLRNIMRKCKYQSTKHFNSHKRKLTEKEDQEIICNEDSSSSCITPENPPERWQPPVVISDLPENVEMTIESKPLRFKETNKGQGIIEVIDIADSSSEEEVETDEEESDSDIEIIQEIIPESQDEEEEEDDDDVEIIEVPLPKKEIVVETLSSDSEDEEGGSGSESEKSYDGNWKRITPKEKNKFVRPPSMSHLNYAAIEEFCKEKKSPIDSLNYEESTSVNESNSGFIRLERSNPVENRPVFRVEKTRNEILDMIPTLAGQNKKLMTVDIPDSRLIPSTITPKQQSYTFSTNVLRARVFRQGFRGRRNFHGSRFPSFNPYHNNINGNFYPNQLNIGGSQGFFQTPQLAHLLGGGDITTVARGVMQFASALLMNMPQNQMNNSMLPYNTRPQFPRMNFHNVEAPNMAMQRFSPINQNFSQPEPANHQSFNRSQQNNLHIQNLFDMPNQRSIGTPNHIRFSDDNSNSPSIENHHNNHGFSTDLTQSSESDFDTNDCSFIPAVGSNSRNNRAANFRSRVRGFRNKYQTHRGRFSQRGSRGGTSHFSQHIDPAYIKPDVPIPHHNINFTPISSSKSNPKPVEIINIDENDKVVSSRGISSKFCNRKQRRQQYKIENHDGTTGINKKPQRKRVKRKLMRLKEKARKKLQNINSEGTKNPEIVFLDSPSVSLPPIENTTVNHIKQEKEAEVKTECIIKEESPSVKRVKQENAEESIIKVEQGLDARVKTEISSEKSSGVRVKVEEGESGRNVHVEIKIEDLSDSSSVVSLPLSNAVKEEVQIKQEMASEVKIEAVNGFDIKVEGLNEQDCKEDIVGASRSNSDVQLMKTDNSERTQHESLDSSNSECERTRNGLGEAASVDQTDITTEVETEEGSDTCVSNQTKLPSEEVGEKNVSSWAEMKKNNMPLHILQDSENQDETVNEDDEDGSLLRPKNCKTIGTVLSALQIFSTYTGTPPENILRLKISFDMYLPSEFRKSHRGLPQYRIVVFSGEHPLPSPAQMREVCCRFQDKVPVLAAVVAPGSIVFYTFTDINLPPDSTSYK